MSLPNLTTPRLSLRPATLDDAAALHALWTDAQVRRFLFDDAPVGRAEADALLQDTLRLEADGLGLWTISERGRATLVGCAGLLPAGKAAAAAFPAARGKVEPLIALHPAAWKRGYAAEALRALIAHAFAGLRPPELMAFVDAPNEASQRLMHRLGFEVLGEFAGPRWPLRAWRLRRPPGP